MVDFKFIEYGTNFGTRDMGMKLREKLLPLINGNEKVVLDFTGVNVVSNSFADGWVNIHSSDSGDRYN